MDQHIYSKGDACAGCTAMATKTTGLNAAVTVASINIRGLTDVKLELILQSFVAVEWDVMFIIDTQLDKEGGDYMGNKIKRRLGTGTRTHASPCILDYGTDSTTGLRRAGGILAVIGPKWGTSLGAVQDDKFGPDGSSAGVMCQVTLNTTDGAINVIGAYWPNKHSATELSDQNLWRCLTRYVRLVDNTPIQLMQSTTSV